MTYVIKVTAEGEISRVPFNADASLAQLQEAVGGYIERLPIDTGDFDIFVNEEGALKGFPHNGIITLLWVRNGGECLIHGDAIIARHDGEGETVGLSEEDAVTLSTVLAGIGKFV